MLAKRLPVREPVYAFEKLCTQKSGLEDLNACRGLNAETHREIQRLITGVTLHDHDWVVFHIATIVGGDGKLLGLHLLQHSS